MAKPWKDGDSARTMTKKYNETAEQVEILREESREVSQPVQAELNKLQEQVDKKLESVTAEDIGLGQVDNTPDSKKPVSEPQSRAIQYATEDKLTSEPANEIEAEETGFITSVSVSGTKLVISF